MQLQLVVIACLLGCLSCLPVDQKQQPVAEIVRSENEYNEDGSYHFYYLTSDGQFREETAHWVNQMDGEPFLVITGSYGYEGPEGEKYQVNYVSDNNGYRATGDHLPTGTGGQTLVQEPDNIEAVDPFMGKPPPVVALPPNAIASLVG